MRVRIDQPAMVTAILQELDRQAPGVQINEPALNTIHQAAVAVASMQRWMHLPHLSEEEQMVTIDRHPGWEAA